MASYETPSADATLSLALINVDDQMRLTTPRKGSHWTDQYDLSHIQAPPLASRPCESEVCESNLCRRTCAEHQGLSLIP